MYDVRCTVYGSLVLELAAFLRLSYTVHLTSYIDLVHQILKSNLMSIRIFITGGTFDKEYNELNGQLYFKDTHMADLLDMGRCRLNVTIKKLMLIDSLDMTETDRQGIVDECNLCEEQRIIITHGTDTMAATAALLAEKIKNKTIVLTGAMIPIAFGSSDGLFNLGSALAFVQALPNGVYVAMNGSFFKHDNVVKNKKTGVFEKIHE
jgi:L-asparaginase